MAPVKKPKTPPVIAIMASDIYHLADLLDTTIQQSGNRLMPKLKPRQMVIGGFTIPTTPLAIDGSVTKDYAVIDIFMGGELHFYILVIGSRTISNPTFLWISSHSPTQSLQSALTMTNGPIPILEFLNFLDGNIKRGFYTDAGKKWRELPEAAYLDLLQRGRADADFQSLLKI